MKLSHFSSPELPQPSGSLICLWSNRSTEGAELGIWYFRKETSFLVVVLITVAKYQLTEEVLQEWEGKLQLK